MKLHPLVFVLLLLLAAGAGFGGGLIVQHRFAPLGAKPPADAAPPAKAEPTWEERKAVQKQVLIDYLDGKELTPVDGKPLGAGGKPLVFRKDGIQAVQFGDTASKSGDTPWGTNVTVLASIDGKRYSIHARLEYREVEKSIVIVSFRPTEVSPQ